MTTSSRVDTTTGHWQERWRGSVMDTYGTPAVALVRGEGARVWDADGRDYVDLLAGIAVNALGHAHPAVVDVCLSKPAAAAHCVHRSFYELMSRV